MRARRTSTTRPSPAPTATRGAGAALAVALAVGLSTFAAVSLASTPDAVPRERGVVVARFGDTLPSSDVRKVADWVAASRDHGDAPFMLVDKRNARLLVFDAEARLLATSPILLGAARGDDSVPGIGDRPLGEIKPHERTTPAGRFVAEAGRNLQGEDIVWVDYDAAVSMHRLRAVHASQRRYERMATPTPADNRISYGCINVPASFFDAYVKPVFAQGRKAPVYVLPEVRPLHELFPEAARASRHAAARAAAAKP